MSGPPPPPDDGDVARLIVGMQIDVPGRELANHLGDRAAYHEDKARQYREQAEGVEALKEPSGQSNDPGASLRQSQRDHQRRANLFDFMARHVIESATYRLSERDLTFVEIIADRFA